MKKKNPTTVRFTLEAEEMVGKLTESLGVTKAAVIEMAIRKFARSEGILSFRHNHKGERQ